MSILRKYKASLKRIKGYQIFQTFNEYRLKGVGTTNIQYPYVYVNEGKEIIYVIKSNESSIIKYNKKGNYWYCRWQYKNDCDNPTTQSWRVYERFIFNDTIIDYNYYLEQDNESKKISRSTLAYLVRTENIIMQLAPVYKIKNVNNPFSELKWLIENYKKIYSSKLYANYRQNLCVEAEKEIKNDTLFTYGEKSNKIKTEFVKLNSMGEFDIYSPNSKNAAEWGSYGFQ